MNSVIKGSEATAIGNSVVVNCSPSEAGSITGNTIKGNNNNLVINYNPAENEYLKEQIRLLKLVVKTQEQQIRLLKKRKPCK